jgi:outer membrane lipoprotein-sorting protein
MTVERTPVSRKIVILATLLMLSTGSRGAFAADDLNKVLAALDASAAMFKSAQADISWDHEQVQPVPDSEVQVGTVLFERKSGQVQMALHIKTDNGKPILKDLVYAGGTGKLYDHQLKQVEVFQVGDKQSQLDAFLTLGFGGSGKDLQKNWTVTYAGTESVGGISAAKLQLIPRDASVAKTTPKVLLWIDVAKGVALKQQRFEPSGDFVLLTYTNLHLNGPVPSGSFDLKTPPGTQVVNH